MSHHCVSSGDSSALQTERKPGHTGGRNIVSLPCGFPCASSSGVPGRRTLYTWCKSKVSCQRGFVGASSGYRTGRKTCHKRYRGRAVHQYGSGGVFKVEGQENDVLHIVSHT